MSATEDDVAAAMEAARRMGVTMAIRGCTVEGPHTLFYWLNDYLVE